MKIGIFGDSFAQKMSEHSWTVKLESLLDADFTNYGLAGSDLYWSYNLFRQHHQDYDLNIFVATGSCRTSYFTWDRDTQSLKHVWMQKGSVHDSINWNKNLFKYDMTDVDKRLHKNNVYEWANYTNVDVVKHLAIYDSIKYLNKNTILINAFNEIEDRCMSHIAMIDYEYHKRTQGPENVQVRPNHMSVAQNKIFAHFMFEHIKGSRNIVETMEPTTIKEFYPVTKNLTQCGFDG